MGKMYNLAAYDSELVLCPEAAARWVADSSVNSFSHSSGGWKVSFGSIPSGGLRESLLLPLSSFWELLRLCHVHRPLQALPLSPPLSP